MTDERIHELLWEHVDRGTRECFSNYQRIAFARAIEAETLKEAAERWHETHGTKGDHTYTGMEVYQWLLWVLARAGKVNSCSSPLPPSPLP